METVDKNPPSVLSDPQEGEHPAINFLWVILDGSKLTDGQKKKIGRRYKAFSLKPSHIFDSNGSRCVLLWSLKKTTPEDIPKPVIENLLKRLASHFYGDPGIPDLPQDLPQWEIAESHPERNTISKILTFAFRKLRVFREKSCRMKFQRIISKQNLGLSAGRRWPCRYCQ